MRKDLLDNDEIYQEFISLTPMKCLSQADDVVNVALFLASAHVSHITGHTLPADGD